MTLSRFVRPILTLALASLAVLPGLVPEQAYAAKPTAQSLQRQQAELQRRAARLSRELAAKRARAHALRKKEAQAVGKLSVLQQRLEQTATELRDSQFRLATTQSKLHVAHRKLSTARQDFARQQRASATRLRAIYKHKALDEWQALFTAPDLATFYARYAYFKRMSSRDAEMLETLDRKKAVIHQQEKQISVQRDRMATITASIGTQKAELSDLTQDQSQLVSAIKTQRQAAEQEVSQLEADSSQIEGLIRRIIAQRRALEREAARRQGRKYTGGVKGSGRFIWPAAGVRTSPFGYRMHPILKRPILHRGLDIGAYAGTPIHAADHGEVIFAGWYGGYGKVVILDHGGDLTTLYAHTSAIHVSVGQRVKKGQLIAKVGTTGLSTGPHLHFEARRNGTPVDPLLYLP